MTNTGKDQDFRNYIGYPPYNNAVKKGNRPPKKKQSYPFNASGDYNMCCGLAATGEEAPAEEIVPNVPKVRNLMVLDYAKTALAIVGLYVIVMYLYKKYKK